MVPAAEHESANEDKNPYQGGTGAVYVMTNQDTGNAVTVLERAADGGLTQIETFPTGGLGNGNATSAANALDPLTSQGSLILSDDHRFLFAVNAGSNEVSVLAIEGNKLIPVDRVPSEGTLPVSVTVHNNLLYVLNRIGSTITGFTVGTGGKLSALAGSTQSLIRGENGNPTQIRFTPAGTQLVVTELANNLIEVLTIDEYGRAGPPVANQSSGPGPFGFTFAKDLLIVSEFTSNAASSYRVTKDSTLQVVSGSVPTTEQGACWVVTNSTTDPRYAYVSNVDSGSISGYRIDGTGVLSLLDPDGQAGVTVDSRGAIDSAVSGDGRFLYVLTGGFSLASEMPDVSAEMSITSFRIEADGSLTTIPGPDEFPPGTQGIAAI
jgi:6-phosphogluconolactonase